MSKERVEDYFRSIGREDLTVLEFETSSATVELAAQAVGAPPERIAKTLGLRLKDRDILIVMCGTARLSNQKFKDLFHCKAKMLTPEQTLAATGHPVGGVCPFGLATDISVYLDQSLCKFDYVYPAAGAANNAVKIRVEEFPQLTGGQWIDVCQETADPR